MWNKRTSLPGWIVFYEELRNWLTSGRINSQEPLNLEKVKQSLRIALLPEEERQAIDYLIAEGLLKQEHHQITAIHLPVRSKRDVGFITDYSAAGRHPSIQTLQLEVIPVAEVRQEAKKYLPYEDQELMIRHLNVQSVDGIPYAVSDSYIPYQYFSSLLPQLKNTTIDLYHYMQDLNYPVTNKKECLYVDMPTLYERRLLQLIDLLRVQIVRLECRVWSGDILVEVCLLCDRADLYEFHYDIPMVG